MNLAGIESPFIMEAKTCGCKNKERNISYHFIESTHSLCVDKKEIIVAQIQACERLLKYVKDEMDIIAIKKEISELKLALDLIHY
jgi:hypothetical protein